MSLFFTLKGDSDKITVTFRYRLLERERATTIAIAIVGRAITLEREASKKKQRTDTKKDAKRIKSDNFTRSNIRKINDWMAT